MGTFYDAVLAVLGEYSPIETMTTENIVLVQADGSSSVQAMPITHYGFNWNWGISAALFVVMIYCFLRAVGGFLKCKI